MLIDISDNFTMESKVFVFGGSGNSGKYLLKMLSGMQGVQVVAASRNPQKAQAYPNVKWIKAEPKDRKTYVEEMKGSSVVMSLLGSEDKKHVDIYSKGYPEILKAMEECHVDRLIMVTASHDHPDQPFFFKHVIRPAFLSHVFEDMERMDKFMKDYKGPVKYTNLRPMRLVDGKRNKKEKCVPSHSAESKGWTFECNM